MDGQNMASFPVTGGLQWISSPFLSIVLTNDTCLLIVQTFSTLPLVLS